MVALRSHTPKHFRGGWSHYTDTREPVDGYGTQNVVTVKSGFQTSDLTITGPHRRWDLAEVLEQCVGVSKVPL
jgi:hypothetical protein